MTALSLYPQVKNRVGVLNFVAKGVSATEASAVSDLFRSELVSSGKFDILDRNNMDKVLKEQEFQQANS
ncbi:MAG: hypothetical protein HZC28_10830 [Spirochaetes bacterium]|nr:hypothetical protein [Spirochaetota bacterium]